MIPTHLNELAIRDTLAVWVSIIDCESRHVSALTFIYGFITLYKKMKSYREGGREAYIVEKVVYLPIIGCLESLKQKSTKPTDLIFSATAYHGL